MRKRVVLKLSGNFFGKSGSYDHKLISETAAKIARASQDFELIIIVGGGNVSRGKESDKNGFVKENAHAIGMTATIVNALMLKDALSRHDVISVVLNSYGEIPCAKKYQIDLAQNILDFNQVLICAGGIGISGYSTDSGALYRARELGADLVLKASRVGGVYDSDPEKNPSAQMFNMISIDDYLKRELQIVDPEAVNIAKEEKITIQVFNLFQQGDLAKVILDKIGTIIF